MMIAKIVLILGTSISLFHYNYGLFLDSFSCFHCSDKDDFSKCRGFVICQDSEELCFLQATSVGSAFSFSGGCMAKSVCALLSGAHTAGSSCIECCNASLCNTQLSHCGAATTAMVTATTQTVTKESTTITTSPPTTVTQASQAPCFNDIAHICDQFKPEECATNQWMKINCCRYLNGNWGQWSNWGSCSQTCGCGTMSRTRQCDSPVPQNGGSYCSGNGTEHQTCRKQSCQGACHIDHSTKCHDFGQDDCCSNSWMQSNCCVYCGMQSNITDGNWGTWSNWSRCSDSCGNGTMTRTRQCDNPPPLAGGLNCPGSANESSPCKIQDCHVPCVDSPNVHCSVIAHDVCGKDDHFTYNLCRRTCKGCDGPIHS